MRCTLLDCGRECWLGDVPQDRKLLNDLIELRQAIEPQAANRSAYIEADLRFHGIVVRASSNAFIMQLEMALSAVWKTSFQASIDDWGPDPKALSLHKKLLDAIKAQQPQAAEKAVLSLIERAVARIDAAAP